MIILSKDPEVIEFGFDPIEATITPTEHFYVRDHFERPEIDLETWRLQVQGCVAATIELSYNDLVSLPSKRLPATLECAGNGRKFLVPPSKGVQWHLGGAGTADWFGVPLSEVLNRAGLNTNASEIIFQGADRGEAIAEDKPTPAGEIHFERSIPITKAMKDVLLAYKINGEDLTPAHGFPLRVIVPGWYAMSSVKWLNKIVVSDRPFTGYFQTVDYSYWTRESGQPVRVPISTLQVKSAIARPHPAEVIPCDTEYAIHGAAWSGEAMIKQVEVSTDSGATWSNAAFQSDPVLNAWRLWSFNWRTPQAPQEVTLLARATDERGNTQPLQHNQDYDDYMIHFCLPIEVIVQ